MKAILKNYNEVTGYYEGFAIVAEEEENKGTEENPFTGKDINKIMRKLRNKNLINDANDGVAAIYFGRSENDVPEILEERAGIRIINVE